MIFGGFMKITWNSSLHDLTAEEAEFVWNDSHEQQQAFEKLKTSITESKYTILKSITEEVSCIQMVMRCLDGYVKLRANFVLEFNIRKDLLDSELLRLWISPIQI